MIVKLLVQPLSSAGEVCEFCRPALLARASQAQVAAMDAELEDTQAEFQQLDDKMARVSQVATRIGDRLRVRPR